MENQKKKKYQNTYYKRNKKEPATLIRGIRKNKNPQRERERDRELIVLWGEKYGLNEENDIKFI